MLSTTPERKRFRVNIIECWKASQEMTSSKKIAIKEFLPTKPLGAWKPLTTNSINLNCIDNKTSNSREILPIFFDIDICLLIKNIIKSKTTKTIL